jgi:hypothetical protein
VRNLKFGWEPRWGTWRATEPTSHHHIFGTEKWRTFAPRTLHLRLCALDRFGCRQSELPTSRSPCKYLRSSGSLCVPLVVHECSLFVPHEFFTCAPMLPMWSGPLWRLSSVAAAFSILLMNHDSVRFLFPHTFTHSELRTQSQGILISIRLPRCHVAFQTFATTGF